MGVSANLKSRHDFEPFGVELEPIGDDTTNFNYKYTGQERDTFTNYDYMHFRFYASSIGRFLKPDNIIRNMANPQSWNLYSYVNGNPVNFNDPSGHIIGVGMPQIAWIESRSSFGMTWFDQLKSSWLPWPGQTPENSWYFGATRSALEYYVNQYLNSKKNNNDKGLSHTIVFSVIRCGLFSKAVDIAEIGKLLLEGGLIYGQVSVIQLARDMTTLIQGLLFEGVGDYSILSKGLQAWNTVLQAATQGTPFKIDSKTREAIQDSTYEIYRISQEEWLDFQQLWNEYGMRWGGSNEGQMAVGFLEWYRKRFI